ncbi:MAG TPA: hypothetical protein VH375_03880 [Rhodanobacteraceae bacterium]|jgi:hypothetical protein
MTNRGDARRALRGIAVAMLAARLAACASAPPSAPEAGLFVTPKANKHYAIEGETVPFSALETRLTSEPPSRVVIETSRQRQGAACIVMLGLKLGIPVWTRSLNGRMQQLKSDVETSEVATIESCR